MLKKIELGQGLCSLVLTRKEKRALWMELDVVSTAMCACACELSCEIKEFVCRKIKLSLLYWTSGRN